jgi:hypothetical protein
MEVHVSARRCDLLKQGAHVLGVACGKRPTRMVGRKLGVTDGGHALTPHRVALISNREQGNGDVTENRQVALTELREGLVGSPLQSVVEVVTLSRGKPSLQGRVSGVSQNVHMDLAAPQPELTVRTTATRPGAGWGTRGSANRHNGTIHRFQGWRRGSHPSVENNGRNESTFHPSNRDNKPKLQNKP